jgi:putative PIN family toxin of toxin-antitoxin system
MRVVLDTGVVLSGLASPAGASRLMLIAAWEGAIVPLASVAIMLEYEAVLKRPEHLLRMRLETDDIDRLLDNWAALVEPVVPYFSYRPSIRDPNDEMFVETAINGRAEALITFNVGDYEISDDRTARLGIRICRPGEFLRGLKWRPSATTLSAFRLR